MVSLWESTPVTQCCHETIRGGQSYTRDFWKDTPENRHKQMSWVFQAPTHPPKCRVSRGKQEVTGGFLRHKNGWMEKINVLQITNSRGNLTLIPSPWGIRSLLRGYEAHHCPLQIPPIASYFLEETWHYGWAPWIPIKTSSLQCIKDFLLRCGVVFILQTYETNVHINLSTSKSTYTPWNQYDHLKILEINGYFYFCWYIDHLSWLVFLLKKRKPGQTELDWSRQGSSCIQCSYAMKFFEKWLIRKKLIQI